MTIEIHYRDPEGNTHIETAPTGSVGTLRLAGTDIGCWTNDRTDLADDPLGEVGFNSSVPDILDELSRENGVLGKPEKSKEELIHGLGLGPTVTLKPGQTLNKNEIERHFGQQYSEVVFKIKVSGPKKPNLFNRILGR